MNFDIKGFKNTLHRECKELFLKIIEELADENIYSLALYNSGETWGYLFPTVSTHKGLREVANEYKKDEYYRDRSITNLEFDLKWNPCDSPRHINYSSTLQESERILLQLEGEMEEYWDNGQEDKYPEIHQILVQTCLEVLKQLDSEGVFNSIERTSFVLNLLNGDQSDEERLDRAKYLNPESVYQLYKSEI